MLIISNCFCDTADEGCVKVAVSLTKKIIKKYVGVSVISFERSSSLAEQHLELNKFFLNQKLKKLLRKEKRRILYIPFPAKSTSIAIRTLVLTLFSHKPINLLLTMAGTCSAVAAWIYKLCRTQIFVLSEESADSYARDLGAKQVSVLKAGVDTERFTPVSAEKSRKLKEKYGLDPDRKVVLHVGHLKEGRNIRQLCKLDPQYQILLVVSTLTEAQWDQELREQMQELPNLRIIDRYIPEIQEIYQLADVYFFPVESHSHCIDVPLSALEAAACGKPVVTTDFGEMKRLQGKKGFYFIKSFEACALNQLVDQAIRDTSAESREAVLAYDWKYAVEALCGA